MLGNLFFVGVDDEQGIRKPAHLADTAERAFQTIAFAIKSKQLFLGQATSLLVELLVKGAQPTNRVRDRTPIGQHAAEPTVIDEILPAAFGRGGDRLLRLAFGTHEKHAPALRNHTLNELQRTVDHGHGLL